MNTCWFHMLHDAHDMNVFAITNSIDLCLFSPLQELIYQYPVVRHMLENAQHMAFKIIVIDDNLHALPPQYIRRPYQNRISYFMSYTNCSIYIMSHTIARVWNT